jgi:hypothetical protein
VRPHVSFGAAVRLPESLYDATGAEAVAQLRGLLGQDTFDSQE